MAFAQTISRTLVGCLLALCIAPPVPAVVNGIPAPCQDRRLDCVGLFFTAGEYPASCGGAISGSCVLIAPDQILVKRHSLNVYPGQPLSLIGNTKFRARFRRAVNGEAENSLYGVGGACHGVYQEALIVRLVDPPVQGSDTVLAYLDHPIVNIRPASLDLTTQVRQGASIVLAGWGYSGMCFNAGERWTLRSARGKMPYNVTGDSFWYTPCGISTVAPCLTCPSGGPWVAANMHDSGSGIFIEVPSTTPGDPTPELRLIGTVSTTVSANRLTAFNSAGGLPALRQSPPNTLGSIADFNRDQEITTGDLLTFISAYFAQQCLSDVNLNGDTSVDDLFAFVGAFLEKN